MNVKHTRQYEMLLRVRDFGTTQRQRFDDPGIALDAFADVANAIEDLAENSVTLRSASVLARAARKLAARAALDDLLVKVSQTARVLRARGATIPPFELPSARNDQAMLTTGRHFARDADALATEFTAHRLPPRLITETADAFEQSLRDRGMQRADLTAARVKAREYLSYGLAAVRTLDVIIGNQFAGDAVIQTLWTQARRLGDGRRARAGGVGEQPEAVTPPQVSVPEAGAVV